MAEIDDTKRIELEAAVFRRLVSHLRNRTDVQNIDMMNLAGFCRNCLSNWYVDAAREDGLDLECFGWVGWNFCAGLCALGCALSLLPALVRSNGKWRMQARPALLRIWMATISTSQPAICRSHANNPHKQQRLQ